MLKYFGFIFAQFLAAMVTGGYMPSNVKMSKRDLGIPKGGFRPRFDLRTFNFRDESYRMTEMMTIHRKSRISEDRQGHPRAKILE